MYNFLPQVACIHIFCKYRVVAVDRVLLAVNRSGLYRFHKVVGNSYRDIGTGYFALLHFSIDKCFRIRVFDRYRKHQCSTAAILCYLTGRIGKTLHKRNQAG
ncbi:hypothetical protein D9M68_806470 [compost metagenome]